MNGETIRLKNLTIGYSSKSNTKKVSEHIDASIQSGELTCLLGVNGAGKSTLLKTLSTFLPKLAGKIFIQGKDIDLFSDKELSRIIGVVLTERNELHNLTVSELVAMGRSPYTGFWGRLRKEDKKMVEQSIALVKIEDLATRMMHTLSDGERQKVMIAKALAQETPVIYLDEPTAFLDFPSKVEIMQLLLRLTRETNKTIFLSTHDLELALQIADRIWLMSKNSGIIVGTPEELSLQGHISSFFKSDGFIFDEQTRLFRIQNPYKCTKNQSSHDLSISTLSETDYPELMLVWEASVRATHHFLKEEDILLFKKLIPEKYFDVVRLFAVRNSDNRILGFLGVSDDNIEMLFIHPDARGKGIGSVLLNYALNELHLRKVDVNEQNEKALGFYLHKGFTVKSRSEQDGTGKSYPTLHLEIISPKQKFSVRQARISDTLELKKLYKDTVLSVNRKDYSAEEVEDWASCGDDVTWHELFSEQSYFVAENEQKVIVGFASVNDAGYMHTLFVHKDFQHQGIATLLYQTIEKYVFEKGTKQITSEVSITAKPFFEKQGFAVDKEQKRKANKLCLTNYKMSKNLSK